MKDLSDRHPKLNTFKDFETALKMDDPTYDVYEAWKRERNDLIAKLKAMSKFLKDTEDVLSGEINDPKA